MNFKGPFAILIADLGYGDAGKGSVVDYLTRECCAHTVVRYNGGAQAAHNVVTHDGKHHTFAQFGSGTFLPGVKTHLSRYMILHPLAMLAEERHLRALGVRDAFARTSIERQALVITPFQQAANRLKEMARGDGRHGSCGMGVGETMGDWLNLGEEALFAGDLPCRELVVRKLRRLREVKMAQLESIMVTLPEMGPAVEERRVLEDANLIEITADMYQYFSSLVRLVEPDYLGKLLRQPGGTIFEGAQGVLLDEWYGFYPYNSWSTLTYKNADTLLAENGFAGDATRLGLIRGYATRHGAGPFVTQDETLTREVQDMHNTNNPWQRQFRVGYLDLVALRYALRVTGPVDGLVVTNLDRMEAMPEWKVCDAYRYAGGEAELAGFFEREGELISDISVPDDPTDLARQETLTRLLMEMQPVYTGCERDREGYAEWVSRRLGVPLAITSFGPTAGEKNQKINWKAGFLSDSGELLSGVELARVVDSTTVRASMQ
jgi:adenylosuccinate synthase